MNISVYYGAEKAIARSLYTYAKTISAWTMEAAQRKEPVLPQKPEIILEQLENGLSVLLLDGVMPVGFLTTYHLGMAGNNTWWEVGTGIVPPKYRGHGLGHILYRRIALMHPHNILICTTKNPVSLHLSLEAGFSLESYNVIPLDIRINLCYTVSCFVPNGDPHTCASEHNLGGPCSARVRWALTRVC